VEHHREGELQPVDQHHVHRARILCRRRRTLPGMVERERSLIRPDDED
jgi:hypothetical protein